MLGKRIIRKTLYIPRHGLDKTQCFLVLKHSVHLLVVSR